MEAPARTSSAAPPITARIVLLFSLMAAVLLGTVGLLSYRTGSDSLKSAAVSMLNEEALEKETAVDDWITERLDDIQQTAATQDVVEKAAALVAAAPASAEARSAYALLQQELRPHVTGPGAAHYTEWFVLEPEHGKVVASTNPSDEGETKVSAPYFDRGKSNLYLYISDYSTRSAAPAMIAAIPLRATDGRVVAVLGARLNVAEMSAIVRRQTGLYQTEDAYLVDSGRFLITQPRFAEGPVEMRRKLDTAAVRLCVARHTGVTLAPDYRGIPTIAFYRWNPRSQLGLIVKIDQVEALAPARAFGRSVILISMLAIAGSALLALFMARSITGPLLALTARVRQFGERGNREPAPHFARDEVDLLTTEFDRMAARIAAYTAELAQANHALQAENAERQEVLEVLRSANASLSRECEARQQAEKELRESKRFAESIAMSSTSIIYLFDLDSRRITYSNRNVGEVLGYSATQILELGENILPAILHPDAQPLVAAHHSELRELSDDRALAIEYRVKHADGEWHWLWAREKVFRRRPDGKAWTIMGTAHDITERKRAEEELRIAHAQLEQMVAHSPAVTYRLKLDGERAVANAVSANVTEFFGFTPAECLSHEWWLEQLHPEDRDRAGASIAETVNRGLCRSEFRLRRKSGDYRWIEEHQRLVRDESGQPVELIGVWIDITERKQNEALMENLNRQLVTASREAGMAEIATNVLHNVGNVLNSANISLSVATDKVRDLKLETLDRLAALLRGQNDLAAFFTTDPRGAELPAFLHRLAERLGADRAAVLGELDAVREHVEHINEIVSMQQNYANACGVTEVLPLASLIDDALRLNAGAIARHGLQVIRDYAELPPAAVDRHKLLQILINLIRNAKYALDDGAPEEKRLTLSLALSPSGRAQIAVRDNGVGIPVENLIRIFEHGFTTRKHGHGFGLHSSANAAREMGGTLTAQSDGPGRGAVFTIELPLQPPPKN